MKKLPFALSGSTGRMGQIFKECLQDSSEYEIVFEANSKLSPRLWNPSLVSGVIDFSLPPLFEQALKWSLKHEKPFLSGTTGLSENQKNLLKESSLKIPVLYERNMSIGISFMKKSLKALGQLDSWQVSIIETHHKNKKDSPSGTALSLQEACYTNKNIPITSLREGENLGKHTIIFKKPGEVLKIEHEVDTRRVFVEGALKAFAWLQNQKSGLYSLEDI